MTRIKNEILSYGLKPIAKGSFLKAARYPAFLLAMGLSPWLASCKESIPTGDGPIKPMKEYTLENAREWTDIAKFHAPTVKKSTHNGRAAVIVEVPLEKANEGHYIEKIGIMDMTGKELGSVTLKRERNPLTYAYFYAEILPWSGKIKIFAKCNKHDLWVKEVYAKDLAM